MPSDTVVRARIDSATKQRAALALDSMGLSISDAIRILLVRVADDQKLPFDLDKKPNKATRRAIEELAKGGGTRFDTVEELFKEAGIKT